MKALIVSIIILIFTILFITTNTIWSIDKLSNISQTINTISTENTSKCQDKLDSLLETWKDIEPILSLTTNRNDLGQIEHELARLMISFYKNDDYEFSAAKSAIIDIIGEIASYHGFDLKTIF